MSAGERTMYPQNQPGQLVDYELAGADELSMSDDQNDSLSNRRNDDQVVPDVDTRAPPATLPLKTQKQVGERGCVG